ncbi:putative JmjC domain-containing histone demethylation protein 2C [Vespula maculifrons]|uniref:JmjC domain-containing histone demethylation protein 2C n=1 Tax=Vespula maculifrons TaxID=7453 RepID=A0ABD2CUK1_VESMC
MFMQQEWELTKGSLPWVGAVRRWAEMQDGQRILLTTPSVLVGFRVEVYRAEGTTQWYTAVIVGYNESTKDLTVTDDTVLEDHNEDPSLVQMRLIGDGVVESIMRGEVVGMTPRRSRSSTALTHALVVVSEIQFHSIIKLVTRLVIMMITSMRREKVVERNSRKRYPAKRKGSHFVHGSPIHNGFPRTIPDSCTSTVWGEISKGVLTRNLTGRVCAFELRQK